MRPCIEEELYRFYYVNVDVSCDIFFWFLFASLLGVVVLRYAYCT